MSCRKGLGESLRHDVSRDISPRDQMADVPVICRNLPVSFRRPSASMDREPAARLFPASPAALGGAAVACAQKSSPHRAASRTRSICIMVECWSEASASASWMARDCIFAQDSTMQKRRRHPDGARRGSKAQQGATAASTILQRPLSLERHRPRTRHSPTQTPASDTHALPHSHRCLTSKRTLLIA